MALGTSMWFRAPAVVCPSDGFVSSLRQSGPSSSRTTSRRRPRATVDSVFADLRARLLPHALTAAVAGLAVAAFVEDVLHPDVVIEGVRYDRGPAVVITAALCATVVLVALRSRIGPAAPVAAIAVLTLAALPARAWLLHSPFVFLLVMLLCGLCGYEGRGRWGLAALPVIWTAAVVAVWREPLGVWRNVFFVGGYMTIAWAGGRLVRGPVAQARSAEERARLLEQEQAAAAERAVQDERRRIARELHDIIAHSVSVMTVQAGAVRRVLQPDQERERDALVSIEKTGRDAMAEMRRLVGLLKDDVAPSYAPQPGLAALGGLVTTMSEAGLPVEVTVEGQPLDLTPGMDLTAYRVVQEALTNTLKYAGPARACVTIRWSPAELLVEVANDGGSTQSAATGFGLAGMRERLELYGGRLDSGPRPEGGYLVSAHLPLEAAT